MDNCQATYAECVCNGGFDVPFPKADGVLEGPMVDKTSMRADVIHGDGSGFQVGAIVPVTTTNALPNEIVLVPVTRAAAPMNALVLDPTGRPYACSWNDTVKKLPVTKDQTIDALRADNCSQAMTAIAREWTQMRTQCGPDCSTSGGDARALIGLALLAVIWRARRGRVSADGASFPP